MSDIVKREPSTFAKRIKVTLGLSAAGGVAGAITGGVTGILVALPMGKMEFGFGLDVFTVGAMVGGALGTLLLPIAAWTLMRNVPFGKALLGTIAGALLGGFAGYFMIADNYVLVRSIFGGIVGFCVSAYLLRKRALTNPVSSNEMVDDD